MRIVFIGTVEFSRRALEHLLSLDAEIAGVCTSINSGFNSDYADLGIVSRAHGLPVYYGDDLNSPETVSWISDKRPDVIFCFGWSRLLKSELLALAPMGVVGFHPAALPANRGRHPIVWALALGLDRTAATFFFMNEGADSGDILSQRFVEIQEADDASTLYDKIVASALGQIAEFLPQLASGSFQRRKQDDRLANTWRKRGIRDGEIDWRMSARSIHNLVRGLTRPYVGAHFMASGREVKVWKTVLVSGVPNNIEPGKVLPSADMKPIVKCGDEAICLLETDPAFEPKIGDYL